MAAEVRTNKPALPKKKVTTIAKMVNADRKELPIPTPIKGTRMVQFNYEEAPITDIVTVIIMESANKGASDIHFDPTDTGLKIRFRVDGTLHDYTLVPAYVQKNMVTRIKIISGMNITESRVPQDGAVKNAIEGKTIDLRVSCLPTNLGEKIVVRLLDYSKSSAGIEDLDFSAFNIKKIYEIIKAPNGIILVTGATGSGKSTTVYAILQRLNTEDRNIITIEDPVELNIDGINQVQANSEIGLTFATVLRSILRQDPDIIMVGEIRDNETAQIAVKASITGHLVVSTIHTNSALNTIERLVDMDVERYLLGTALTGIISQKLAKRLCPDCKELRPTNEYEQNVFKIALKQNITQIYTNKGCDKCLNGFRGRIAVHEVLQLNQDIRDAITKNVPKDVMRNLVYEGAGTQTLLQDGLGKVLEGHTTFEEILGMIDFEDDFGSDNNSLGEASKAVDSHNTTDSSTPLAAIAVEQTAPTMDKLDVTPAISSPMEVLDTLDSLESVPVHPAQIHNQSVISHESQSVETLDF